MKKYYQIFLLTILGVLSVHANAECKIKPNANIVLLKLDDVVGEGMSPRGVSRKWLRVTRFLEDNKIAASYGVIGESLLSKNPAYYAWLKARVNTGTIELWNHGYIRRYIRNKALGKMGEFNGRSAEQQAESLVKTQALAKQKIGVTFQGFGPHDSAVDQHTYQQLDYFKEIRYVWFYEPKDALQRKIVVFKRIANIEYPLFRPNYERFLKDYNKRPKELGYIALQGHPDQWRDQDFDSFVRIVRFLQAENATFCKPLDLLDNQ